MPSTSYPASGISVSERSALWDFRGEPNPNIKFREATQREILDAVSEEESGNMTASLYLARQGLYDSSLSSSFFHPSMVVFGVTRLLNMKEKALPEEYNTEGDLFIKLEGHSYSLKQNLLERVIEALKQNPELLYVN